ncbi:zinc ribbon domain-containing protein [Helicobacter sp. 23-1044]
MNNDLLNLIKISEIDKRASAKEPQIAAIEYELESKVKELNSLEWDLEEIRNDIKKSRVEISNSELTIAENSEKIAQLEKKMAVAKSEREFRALDAENGISKEKITFANQIIADLEAKIANFKEKESAIIDKMNELQEIIKETQVSVNERVGVIHDELKTIFNEKALIAKTIENKLIVFYEKVRKWAKDSSVVPIKKQACSGCFIRINDRIFVDLFKADAITTCPHCGRILYLEQSERERYADSDKKTTKKSAESSKKSSAKSTKSAESSAKKATKKSAESSAKKTTAKSTKSAESKKSATKSKAKK